MLNMVYKAVSHVIFHSIKYIFLPFLEELKFQFSEIYAASLIYLNSSLFYVEACSKILLHFGAETFALQFLGSF